MPHKYQREIEEILRNMEQSEPQHGPNDRVRSIPRATPSVQRSRPRGRAAPRFRASPIELVFGLGIVAALVAAGLAFTAGASVVSGALGIVAFALFAFGCVSSWMQQTRGTPAPRRMRGTTVDAATPITMRRRGLFGEVATQMRIMRLKWRYWRKREH